MAKILEPATGLVPALYQVENPSFAARLGAAEVGNIILIERAVGALVDTFEEDTLSLNDFVLCLELMSVQVPDPAMMLVNARVADFDEHVAASTWFGELKKTPGMLPGERREEIICAFKAYLESRHDDLIERFHQRFNKPNENYTVFVSEDGQIFVGQYESAVS